MVNVPQAIKNSGCPTCRQKLIMPPPVILDDSKETELTPEQMLVKRFEQIVLRRRSTIYENVMKDVKRRVI